MKTPIIVDEHGDITVYRTSLEAEQALEAIDVRNGEYIIYDAAGHLLEAKIGTGRSGFPNVEVVRIMDRLAADNRTEELTAKLTIYLKSVRLPSVDGIASLDDLISRVMDFQSRQ